MTDWPGRHCRFFYSLITRRTPLYSEMATTGALVNGVVARPLDFTLQEYPVEPQLGGSNPADLAHCARPAAQWSYAEINLNCGCPSERVQRGAFGAFLMAEPDLVADCIQGRSGRGGPAGYGLSTASASTAACRDFGPAAKLSPLE